MFLGTIAFYYVIPISLTLTMAGGSESQRKATHLGFIFSRKFQLNRMKFDGALKQFKNILILFLRAV